MPAPLIGVTIPRYQITDKHGEDGIGDDNFAENLAKLCQKAGQQAHVTETAVAATAANGQSRLRGVDGPLCVSEHWAR